MVTRGQHCRGRPQVNLAFVIRMTAIRRDHAATILTTLHSIVDSMNTNNSFRNFQCFNKGCPSDNNKFMTNNEHMRDTMSIAHAFESDAVF